MASCGIICIRRCWKSRQRLMIIVIIAILMVISLLLSVPADNGRIKLVISAESNVRRLNSSLLFHHNKVEPNSNKTAKLILFFNIKDEDDREILKVDRQMLITSGCPVLDCRFTRDMTNFNQSDVVIFLDHDVKLPDHRFPHQHFIYFQTESPVVKPFAISHKRQFNFFNRTMTYRLDSDIVLREGQVLPKHVLTLKNQFYARNQSSRKNIPVRNKKTKLVAWFPTICEETSGPMSYVQDLSRYVKVDIYGKCGNMTCKSTDDCYEMLRNDYKFYLAFEDSLCVDHVTKEFFLPLYYDTVPVVLGGADYNMFAPNHSFIDSLNFDSARGLADHLLLLDRKDKLYSQYFDWKEDFRVDLNPKDGWCDLCQFAHNPQPPFKVYPDINLWWSYDVCGTKFNGHVYNRN